MFSLIADLSSICTFFLYILNKTFLFGSQDNEHIYFVRHIHSILISLSTLRSLEKGRTCGSYISLYQAPLFFFKIKKAPLNLLIILIVY